MATRSGNEDEWYQKVWTRLSVSYYASGKCRILKLLKFYGTIRNPLQRWKDRPLVIYTICNRQLRCGVWVSWPLRLPFRVCRKLQSDLATPESLQPCLFRGYKTNYSIQWPVAWWWIFCTVSDFLSDFQLKVSTSIWNIPFHTLHKSLCTIGDHA